MSLFKKFIVAVILVSAFSGIVGCEGGCQNNPTSPEQSQSSSK